MTGRDGMRKCERERDRDGFFEETEREIVLVCVTEKNDSLCVLVCLTRTDRSGRKRVFLCIPKVEIIKQFKIGDTLFITLSPIPPC